MSTELNAALLGIEEDAGDVVERNRGTGLRERRLARRERIATELQDLEESMWRKRTRRNKVAKGSRLRLINLKDFNLCTKAGRANDAASPCRGSIG